MIHIVLVEPEIPQNTGNISRTCAVTGAVLHLIRPLGFDISDKYLKRAGLDYWDKLELHIHDNLDAFFQACPDAEDHMFLATSKGPRSHTQVSYPETCYLLFGKETAGLPQWLRETYADRCVRIPMRPGIRCLNLSNAAAVLCYEVLRQQGFPGLTGLGEMAD